MKRSTDIYQARYRGEHCGNEVTLDIAGEVGDPPAPQSMGTFACLECGTKVPLVLVEVGDELVEPDGGYDWTPDD